MTIGLTWRRTARRIKRLKETVLAISPDYLGSPDPRLFDALMVLAVPDLPTGNWIYMPGPNPHDDSFLGV